MRNEYESIGFVWINQRRLLSRLVIIEFKPRTPELDWEAAKKKFIKNSSFACSLYKYLLEDLEIAEDFSPCRYRSSEKDDLLRMRKRIQRLTLRSGLRQLRKNALKSKTLPVNLRESNFSKSIKSTESITTSRSRRIWC